MLLKVIDYKLCHALSITFMASAFSARIILFMFERTVKKILSQNFILPPFFHRYCWHICHISIWCLCLQIQGEYVHIKIYHEIEGTSARSCCVFNDCRSCIDFLKVQMNRNTCSLSFYNIIVNTVMLFHDTL